MRTLPAAPVFTKTEAAALGWTTDALRHAVRTGAVVRLRRGVYTSVERPGPVEHAIAAAKAHPGAVVSHRSAALLLGLPLVGPRPEFPELTVQPREPANTHQVRSFRATLRPEDVVSVRAVAATSPARTLVDVARHGPLTTAVALGDAALHAGTTADEVDDVLRFCWSWPRIRRAQRAARLLDPLAESPLESLSRLILRSPAVPRPVTQQVICTRSGRFVARTDFYWEEPGVVGEADGGSKYESLAVLLAEKRRQEQLESLGLIVVRWGWSDVRQRPRDLIRRIEAALERGRHRSRSGFPREWALGGSLSAHAV